MSCRLVRSYSSFSEVDVVALVPEGEVASAGLATIASHVALIPIRGFYSMHARVRTVWTLARAQTGGPPFRVRKFLSKRAAETIVDLAARRDYDLIHCDHLSTVPYRQLVSTKRAVLMEHNVEWELFGRLAQEERNIFRARLLAREARQTALYEQWALGQFDHVFALSKRDQELLLELRPQIADLSSVWPVPVIRRPVGPPPDAPQRVVALGSLSSIGRVRGLRWFLRDIWPFARDRNPGLEIDIVGARPPRDILQLNGSQGIRVHGFVTDLEPLLGNVHACVIPLTIGGGIRIKILEMLARGIPCVGTPVGLQGLDTAPGCRVALGAAEWVAALDADSIRGLRSDAALAAEEFAEQRSPEVSARVLRTIIYSTLRSAPKHVDRDCEGTRVPREKRR